VQVDLEGPFPLTPGDTFLLCSDGLSGQVSDDEIAVVLQVLPPSEAVRTLVDLANLRGGPDNITVIVARVVAMPAGGSATSSSISLPKSPSSNASKSNPVFWVVFGVAALAAAALMFTGETKLAFVSSGVALASLVGMLFRSSSNGDGASAEMPKGQLGRGPYRSQVYDPNAQFLERLAGLIEPIRQSATEQRWNIDWSSVDRLCASSHEAAERGDNASAARELCRALSLLMQEVRAQSHKKSAGPAA
jgi:protein phosphatase